MKPSTDYRPPRSVPPVGTHADARCTLYGRALIDIRCVVASDAERVSQSPCSGDRSRLEWASRELLWMRLGIIEVYFWRMCGTHSQAISTLVRFEPKTSRKMLRLNRFQGVRLSEPRVP